MNSFDEVFENVKKYCVESGGCNEIAARVWINPLRAVSLEGNKAIIEADSDFQRDTAIANYKDLLLKAFENVIGFPVELEIRSVAEEEIKSKAPTYDDDLDKKNAELEKSYESAKYDYTFDTFIVGRSNEFAYAACKAVARNSEEKMNPLFIYGDSGLGKTHLLMAICHEYKQKNPDSNIIYVTSEEFGNELIYCIQTKTTQDFHNKYRNADVLLIDDIQFFSGKESMQEEFFHTFNKLHSEGKQIVITSDRPPKEVKTLTDRLRNRFESGILADISTPEFETRVAIIRRKAELLDLDIPDDVADFIASRLKTNIRQLEGAVKKLKALKHLAGSSPSISMAQSVIRDILTDEQPIPITVEKIIAEVAKVYGVSSEDLRSTKRASQISTARKVAIYVVREVTQMPLAAIGTEFGGRDHSTIVYAINNITNAINKDSNLKQLVDDIVKSVKTQNI
jgi:chromosomal replication initiator protein